MQSVKRCTRCTSMQRRKKLQCCKQAMLQTKQCCRHSSAAHKAANTTELQRNGAIKNEPIQTSHILAHSTITISVQQCAVQAAMHGRHKQCISNANARHVLASGKRLFITSLTNHFHTSPHLPASIHPVTKLLVIKAGANFGFSNAHHRSYCQSKSHSE